MSDPSAAEPPNDDDRAELERLREEVARLQDDRGRRGRRWTGRGRWLAAGVLVVVVGVLTPVAVLARYARSEVLDTDRYVATVAPLARNPEVRSAVANAVTDEVFTQLDVEGLADRALQELVELGAPEPVVSLAQPLADQVRSFVHERVLTFLRSERFATLWTEANRVAHQQVDALLTGEDRGAVDVDDGTVTLDLGKVVAAVKQQLVDDGFALAQRIPEVGTQLTLVESADLEAAQRGVRLLDRLGAVLPWVAAIVVIAAVFVAPNRRRGLLAAALAAVIGLLLVGGALAVARTWYVDHGQPQYLTKDAALDIAHAILAPLRTTLRAAFVFAGAVALAAFVAGPSVPARAVRRAFTGGVATVRERAAGDRPPTNVERWVAANKIALRVAVVGAGAVVFVLWTYPSGAVVLTIVALVVAGLVAIELVGRSPAPNRPSTIA